MKRIFLSMLACSVLAVSCTDDDVQTYDNSAYLVGFENSTAVRSYVATGDVVDLNIPVLLLGGQTGTPVDSDVSITYSVDASSTATAGNEFTLVGGNSIVMPAGSTFANIPIQINTANLEAGPDVTPKVLVLNIDTATSADEVVVAQQYKQITITINGLCFSDLAGMYTVSVVRQDTGAVYSLPGDELFQEGDGYYLTSSTGPYNTRGLISSGAQLASPTPGFYFTDVCGAMSLEQQQLASVYSNIVTQDAAQAALSVSNEETGTFVIAYSVWFTNNTIERRFVGTYTPE